MPTARGWTVVGTAVGLAVVWWVFGEVELLGAAAAMAVAVGLAMAWVAMGAPSIEVTRAVTPITVQAGDDVRVRLTVANRRRLPLPMTTLEDPIPGLGTAAATLSGLRSSSSAAVPYRIAARRRGVYTLGPVVATTRDPLGLAERARTVGPRDHLVVHPRIERLSGLPSGLGRDPATEQARPDLLGRSGEDFYTIREFRHGDDLRRVHWPTTARRDELMIRQLETPWQSRGLVVLDTRAQVYADPEAFETAVRGAASVIDLFLRSAFDLEVLVGSTHFVADVPDARARIMEALAGIGLHPSLDLPSVASSIRLLGGGGSLVVVTGSPDDQLARAVRRLAGDHASVVVGAVTATPIVTIPGTRATVATVTTDGSWAGAWTALLRRPRATV